MEPPIRTTMRADENGLINTIRRKELSLYKIITEILGNMNGSHVVMNIKDGYLQVFQNDGGLSLRDKESICRMYRSGVNDNTASLNGIGIRGAFDRICHKYNKEDGRPITLTHQTMGGSGTYEFYFHQEPLWEISDVQGLSYEIIYEYQDSCRCAGLQGAYGTMWRVPLNDTYISEFAKSESDILQIIRRFFNRRLMSRDIQVYYQGNLVTVDRPLCNTASSISFDVELCYDGDICNNRTPRYLRVKDYNNLCREHPEISEHMKEKMKLIGPNYKMFTTSDKLQRHCETLSITMKLYDPTEFNGVKAQYEYASNQKLKGVWLYCSDMCLLEKPIMRHSAARDYMKADFCPIIEVQVDRSTKLFTLCGDKTVSQETKGNGTHFLKFIWGLFFRIYGHPDAQAPVLAPARPPALVPAIPEGAAALVPAALVPAAPEGAEGHVTKDRSQIPHLVHMEIWKRRFGMDVEGPCICCHNTIDAISRGHEIGHIQPVCLGGTNEWMNIIPICRTCNSNMADKNMDDWMRDQYESQYERYSQDLARYLSSEYSVAAAY